MALGPAPVVSVQPLPETGTNHMTTSTDLVLTTTEVAETLLHGGEVAVAATDDIQDDMVRRILESGSLEEAFASFESVPAKDVEGKLLEVHGIRWMRSKYKEGPKVYALLQCRLGNTKDDIVVSMGGRTTMASFLYAQQHEAMPFKGTFRQLQSNTDPEKSYWTFNLAPAKA